MLTMVVKAYVDTVDVQKRLATIVADKGLQEKIAAQQQQLKQLEDQMRALNATLNTAPANSSTDLRKERNVILGNIQDLDNKKLVAVQVIDSLTEKVKRYIAPNMTMKEVESIMGSPRGRAYPFLKDFAADAWNYGDLWVNFNGGVVKCISREQGWYKCPRQAN